MHHCQCSDRCKRRWEFFVSPVSHNPAFGAWLNWSPVALSHRLPMHLCALVAIEQSNLADHFTRS